MPLRFGCAASSAVVWFDAFVWSSLQYCTPQYLMFGYFFSSAAKPDDLWSVVLMPGATLIDATSPFLPIARARASAAARPPARLSVDTLLNAIGFVMNVSTVSTAMPALIARWIGAIKAVLSVGAMRIASGLLAIAAFRYGICVAGENAAGEPVNLTFTPSFFAAAWAPLFIVR